MLLPTVERYARLVKRDAVPWDSTYARALVVCNTIHASNATLHRPTGGVTAPDFRTGRDKRTSQYCSTKIGFCCGAKRPQMPWLILAPAALAHLGSYYAHMGGDFPEVIAPGTA
jgi:hypothetical protein